MVFLGFIWRGFLLPTLPWDPRSCRAGVCPPRRCGTRRWGGRACWWAGSVYFRPPRTSRSRWWAGGSPHRSPDTGKWEWNFYRTPAGCTAKEKTRRKRNRGYQGLLSVAQQPSPPSPPPPPHTPRAFWAAWGCVIRTPPPHSTCKQAKFSDF